jgi:SAM-dependent methyltransferase
MQLRRQTWLPFDPDRSYTRRYNDHFYSEVSDQISGTVVDLGAQEGNEHEYKTLSDDVDEYIAIDISHDASLDIRADGRQLPLSSASANTVVLSAMLEHVPIEDVKTLLSEVNRILVPGGTAIAYVVFVYPIHSVPPDVLWPPIGVLHVWVQYGGIRRWWAGRNTAPFGFPPDFESDRRCEY